MLQERHNKPAAFLANVATPRAAGFTLIELLVVIAIIGILAGLLVAGVQKVRETANYVSCSNSLRQLGVAAHNFHEARGQQLPPALGWFPGTGPPGAYGTTFFHLLPYLEQDNLYRDSFAVDSFMVGNKQVYSEPIPLFQCPSDPSVPTVPPSGVAGDGQGNSWGVSSYAVNAQVVAETQPDGVITSLAHFARIPASIPDGSSNTLLFTEKYARCVNGNYPAGGNFWGYYFTGPNVPPYYPGFAVSWNSYSIGPGSKFQVQPDPFYSACDPTLASTPHASGIHAGMADASVRYISARINPGNWWHLVTPRGGEIISPDDW